MYRCSYELGKSNPVDAAACARDRLDKAAKAESQTPAFNEAQLKTATTLCAAHVESKKVSKCVAVVSSHINAEGKLEK